MITKDKMVELKKSKEILDKVGRKIEEVVVKKEVGKGMKKVELVLPEVCDSEVSVEFLQGMVNRMVVSFFKYGEVEKGFGKDGGVDAVESLKLRLLAFEEGNEKKGLKKGNVEMLMDVANFAMIRFMFPGEGEYFEATDSDKSVGRVMKDGEVSDKKN